MQNKIFENGIIYNDDCLNVMSKLVEQKVKVDSIICDLPYGVTCLKWDSVLDFKLLWEYYTKLIKDNGCIVLFSQQPFTTLLINSNLKLYRYSWVWDKCANTGFLNSNFAPLKRTEDINVFSKATVGSLSKNPIRYYPQGVIEVNKVKRNNPNSTWRKNKGYGGCNKLNSDSEYVQKYTNYPNNILSFPREKKNVHPTQKPTALLEYLIKTYTKENELVLDNCMGSGSTCVACQNINRRFIGIEKDEKYYNIALNRIERNILTK